MSLKSDLSLPERLTYVLPGLLDDGVTVDVGQLTQAEALAAARIWDRHTNY